MTKLDFLKAALLLSPVIFAILRYEVIMRVKSKILIQWRDGIDKGDKVVAEKYKNHYYNISWLDLRKWTLKQFCKDD